MSISLTHDNVWIDLVGKRFTLGSANARGGYVITLGGARWLIANSERIPAGERVKVTSQDGNALEVIRA